MFGMVMMAQAAVRSQQKGREADGRNERVGCVTKGGEGVIGWGCPAGMQRRNARCRCVEQYNCSRGAGIRVEGKRLAVPWPPCVWQISQLPVNGEVGQTAVSRESMAADEPADGWRVWTRCLLFVCQVERDQI